MRAIGGWGGGTQYIIIMLCLFGSLWPSPLVNDLPGNGSYILTPFDGTAVLSCRRRHALLVRCRISFIYLFFKKELV